MTRVQLAEAVAKRLSFWSHPRTDWPDELIASLPGNRARKIYRDEYLTSANVLINMILEADLSD